MSERTIYICCPACNENGRITRYMLYSDEPCEVCGGWRWVGVKYDNDDEQEQEHERE